MGKNIKHKGQARIFKNPVLEYLTKAPAPVSATIYIFILLVLLYIGHRNEVVDAAWNAVLIYLGALFFWTFFEYFFHRYINHLDEYFPDSEWADKIAYTIHGVHHEYPRDKERLLMPPIPGLLIVAILYGVFVMILGSFVYLFLPGFMTGYLLYVFVHFNVHTTPVPSWLKIQYRHHAIHHYKHPDKAFGVSTTLWDRVFGTMPPEE